jgi:alpha/beta superfamily hydrolase
MPEINIVGPEGRLEGRYHHQPNAPQSPIALILHPHPQFGGTMNNKIVYNLFHSFVQRGFSALRFNFRGVGKSQGSFDNGTGELSDAASALDWLQASNPSASACWVGGFSFGAWISMQLLMRRPEITSFISVAPPANMLDFTFLAPCPASGLIVHGSEDDIVPSEDVDKLTAKLQTQRGIEITYKTISGANHFFEEKLPNLNALVEKYLKNAVV